MGVLGGVPMGFWGGGVPMGSLGLWMGGVPILWVGGGPIGIIVGILTESKGFFGVLGSP